MKWAMGICALVAAFCGGMAVERSFDQTETEKFMAEVLMANKTALALGFEGSILVATNAEGRLHVAASPAK